MIAAPVDGITVATTAMIIVGVGMLMGIARISITIAIIDRTQRNPCWSGLAREGGVTANIGGD